MWTGLYNDLVCADQILTTVLFPMFSVLKVCQVAVYINFYINPGFQ